jgi:hypothetical protein
MLLELLLLLLLLKLVVMVVRMLLTSHGLRCTTLLSHAETHSLRRRLPGHSHRAPAHPKPWTSTLK